MAMFQFVMLARLPEGFLDDIRVYLKMDGGYNKLQCHALFSDKPIFGFDHV